VENDGRYTYSKVKRELKSIKHRGNKETCELSKSELNTGETEKPVNSAKVN